MSKDPFNVFPPVKENKKAYEPLKQEPTYVPYTLSWFEWLVKRGNFILTDTHLTVGGGDSPKTILTIPKGFVFYITYCNLSGHSEAAMIATVRVTINGVDFFETETAASVLTPFFNNLALSIPVPVEENLIIQLNKGNDSLRVTCNLGGFLVPKEK